MGSQTKRGDTIPATDLPPELLADIGKRLGSRLAVAQFRSVCKSWRSSLPSASRFPLRVPSPPGYESNSKPDKFAFFITEINIYIVGGQLLAAFEELDQSCKFRRQSILPNGVDFPVVSRQDHRLSRLSSIAKAYNLRVFPQRYSSIGKPWDFNFSYIKHKIVLISSNNLDPSYSPASNLSVVALLSSDSNNGRLALLRLDESLQNSEDWNTSFCKSVFEDIVAYKNQLCTVDYQGRAFFMDYNSLEMIQVALPLSDFGSQHGSKRLFEASGDLYLATNDAPINELQSPSDVKVYKLSLQFGKWIDIGGLDDNNVFFSGMSYSFSIPRDVLTNTYGNAMIQFPLNKRYFAPPSLLFPNDRNDKDEFDRGHRLLGFTMSDYHCFS